VRLADDLDDDLRDALRSRGLDTVDGAFALAGGEDLHKQGLGDRRRTRLELPAKTGEPVVVYLKRYGPSPCPPRRLRALRNGQARTPGLGEFETVQAVWNAGVPTMRALSGGQDVSDGQAVRSFVLVSTVAGASLEVRAEDFYLRHADDPDALERFTRSLAGLVRGFHQAGFVHRDLYACHVFLDERQGKMDFSLIDLARAFRPAWRGFRWRAKDLSQLKFSMPERWVAGWWGVFMNEYFQNNASLWRRMAHRLAIDSRVRRLRRRHRPAAYRPGSRADG
jgi:hypothetical protein